MTVDIRSIFLDDVSIRAPDHIASRPAFGFPMVQRRRLLCRTNRDDGVAEIERRLSPTFVARRGARHRDARQSTVSCVVSSSVAPTVVAGRARRALHIELARTKYSTKYSRDVSSRDHHGLRTGPHAVRVLRGRSRLDPPSSGAAAPAARPLRVARGERDERRPRRCTRRERSSSRRWVAPARRARRSARSVRKRHAGRGRRRGGAVVMLAELGEMPHRGLTNRSAGLGPAPPRTASLR